MWFVVANKKANNPIDMGSKLQLLNQKCSDRWRSPTEFHIKMSKLLNTERLVSLAWQTVSGSDKSDLANALARFRKNMTARLNSTADDGGKAEPKQLMHFMLDSYVTSITDAYLQTRLHAEVRAQIAATPADSAGNADVIASMLGSIAAVAEKELQQSLQILFGICELAKLRSWEMATIKYLYYVATLPESGGQHASSKQRTSDNNPPLVAASITSMLNDMAELLADS